MCSVLFCVILDKNSAALQLFTNNQQFNSRRKCKSSLYLVFTLCQQVVRENSLFHSRKQKHDDWIHRLFVNRVALRQYGARRMLNALLSRV